MVYPRNWAKKMDIKEIEQLIKLIESTNSITEFALEQEGSSVKITRGLAAPVVTTEGIITTQQVPAAVESAPVQLPEAVKAASDEGLTKVESPIVGNYYSRPSPDTEPFVQGGKNVKKGETLCIVEAMKLMNEIEAPCNGTVEKVFLSDGQVVEYGELLFLIRPA